MLEVYGRASLRHDFITLSLLNRHGEEINNRTLRTTMIHEIGHIYDKYHPEVKQALGKDMEQFANMWQRKWR